MVRPDRHAHAEERRDDITAEERLVSRIVRMRDQRDARRDQLRARGFDFQEPSALGLREPDAMIGAGLLAILELRLRDRRPEVDVPQGRRLELIRQVPLQQAQKRQLRDALRPPIDGRVGHRPVHRQPEGPPQMLEDFFVLRGQPRAQLDEVGTRHRDRLLPGLVRRREGGVIRQRRIAAHAVVVLHPALGGQAVVVPPHRVEHRACPACAETARRRRYGCRKTRVRRAAIRSPSAAECRWSTPRRADASDRTGRRRWFPSGGSTSLRAPRVRVFRVQKSGNRVLTVGHVFDPNGSGT